MKELFSGLLTPDPGVIDGLVAITILYFLAVGPARKYLAPGVPFDKLRACSFLTGLFILIAAVATPIDHIGETYLFSVHMIQHVLLMFALPPFLIWGTPTWLSEFLFRTEGLGAILRFLVKPVPAAGLFVFVLHAWHVPGLYELALRDDLIHLLEHACFIASSVLMYWPLLGARSGGDSVKEREHPGIKLLYILGVSIGQLPLFAFLTFATSVFYPTYEAAPRYTDLSPIADQMLGGVIMKLAVVVFMFVGLAVVFTRWYMSEPRFSKGGSQSYQSGERR